jgi:hypothetical protein
MARHLLEENLKAIEAVIRPHSGGLTSHEISKTLKSVVPLRTLQYRLKYLVDNNRLIKKDEGRQVRYYLQSKKQTNYLLP